MARVDPRPGACGTDRRRTAVCHWWLSVPSLLTCTPRLRARRASVITPEAPARVRGAFVRAFRVLVRAFARRVRAFAVHVSDFGAKNSGVSPRAGSSALVGGPKHWVHAAAAIVSRGLAGRSVTNHERAHSPSACPGPPGLLRPARNGVERGPRDHRAHGL